MDLSDRRPPFLRKRVILGLIVALSCGGGDPAPDAATDVIPDLIGDSQPDSGPCGPCPSGYCVTPSGQGTPVCASTCQAGDCPEGFQCRTVADGDGVLRLCLPDFERLCWPCMTDGECRPAGIPTLDICVGWGYAGSFCGRDCAVDACPEGYRCVDAPTGEAGTDTVRQCMPDQGVQCSCSQEAIAADAETECSVTSEFGICQGARACMSDGLSSCDAQIPVPEECDGIDNDCDGVTDEGLKSSECVQTFGSVVCRGPQVCDMGNWVCSVQPPGPESCDGIDNDCDGNTDEGEGNEHCLWFFRDKDGDGHGGKDDGRCLCYPVEPWIEEDGDDCNDLAEAVYPGADEVCNDKDDDCDEEVDEDFECRLGQEESEPCGKCGATSHKCTTACAWDSWTDCQETGVCEKGEKKLCSDACGDLYCNDLCQWDESCTPIKDAYEKVAPNDTLETAKSLGSFTEGSSPDPVVAWIHSSTDIDWYSFAAAEGSEPADGKMEIQVSLESKSGSHGLCVHWDRFDDGSIENSKCVDGTGDLQTTTENLDQSGETESGRIYVEISGDWSCATYTLKFVFD